MKEYNNYIEFDNLNTPNLFSKRPLDFKNDKDMSLKMIPNYWDKIVFPNQNHTNNIGIYDGTKEVFVNTDGLITNIKGVALATLVADCQSILLYDEKKEVIGNIHSGWKGTLNRIVENAINKMIEIYNCNPKDIKAFICPSICQNCFEVKKDVKDLFEKEFKDIDINLFIKKEKDAFYIDMVGINEMLMKKLGLISITKSNICTKCQSNIFHSYRNDGEQSGRNIAIIALKK